jgi:phenylalanyl-tRNA synthetase beta chain
VRPHPNADKLTLCDVDTGSEKLRVVCGAPNHKKGDIVALATVGTRFGEEFTVKKTKIRGEDSSGMLCSEKEMGLSDDHSGIMILPPDTKLGSTMSGLFPAWRDTRIEIDNKSITHRPDLWSHAGFAREIAALYGRAFKSPVDPSIAKGFPADARRRAALLRAFGKEHQDRGIARMAEGRRERHRHASHQQHRRHHQLRDGRDRSAHARLRPQETAR